MLFKSCFSVLLILATIVVIEAADDDAAPAADKGPASSRGESSQVLNGESLQLIEWDGYYDRLFKVTPENLTTFVVTSILARMVELEQTEELIEAKSGSNEAGTNLANYAAAEKFVIDNNISRVMFESFTKTLLQTFKIDVDNCTVQKSHAFNLLVQYLKGLPVHNVIEQNYFYHMQFCQQSIMNTLVHINYVLGPSVFSVIEQIRMSSIHLIELSNSGSALFKLLENELGDKMASLIKTKVGSMRSFEDHYSSFFGNPCAELMNRTMYLKDWIDKYGLVAFKTYQRELINRYYICRKINNSKDLNRLVLGKLETLRYWRDVEEQIATNSDKRSSKRGRPRKTDKKNKQDDLTGRLVSIDQVPQQNPSIGTGSSQDLALEPQVSQVEDLGQASAFGATNIRAQDQLTSLEQFSDIDWNSFGNISAFRLNWGSGIDQFGENFFDSATVGNLGFGNLHFPNQVDNPDLITTYNPNLENLQKNQSDEQNPQSLKGTSSRRGKAPSAKQATSSSYVRLSEPRTPMMRHIDESLNSYHNEAVDQQPLNESITLESLTQPGSLQNEHPAAGFPQEPDDFLL